MKESCRNGLKKCLVKHQVIFRYILLLKSMLKRSFSGVPTLILSEFQGFETRVEGVFQQAVKRKTPTELRDQTPDLKT